MSKEVLTEIVRLKGIEARVTALANQKQDDADYYTLRSLDQDELMSADVLHSLALRCRTEAAEIREALNG